MAANADPARAVVGLRRAIPSTRDRASGGAPNPAKAGDLIPGRCRGRLWRPRFVTPRCSRPSEPAPPAERETAHLSRDRIRPVASSERATALATLRTSSSSSIDRDRGPLIHRGLERHVRRHAAGAICETGDALRSESCVVGPAIPSAASMRDCPVSRTEQRGDGERGDRSVTDRAVRRCGRRTLATCPPRPLDRGDGGGRVHGRGSSLVRRFLTASSGSKWAAGEGYVSAASTSQKTNPSRSTVSPSW